MDSGARAAAPTFTTDAPQDGNGPFTDPPVAVTIATATPGATIYYTLDGTDPTTDSAVFTSPISISRNGETVIRAIALAGGLGTSEVATVVIMTGDQVMITPGTTLQSIGCRDGFLPSAVNAFSY